MHVPTKNKLVHNAIPTLFNIPNPPAKITMKRRLPVRHQQEGPKRKKKKGKKERKERNEIYSSLVSTRNEMNGFYDPVWHCKGLVELGDTWTNEMKFFCETFPRAIARPGEVST